MLVRKLSNRFSLPFLQRYKIHHHGPDLPQEALPSRGPCELAGGEAETGRRSVEKQQLHQEVQQAEAPESTGGHPFQVQVKSRSDCGPCCRGRDNADLLFGLEPNAFFVFLDKQRYFCRGRLCVFILCWTAKVQCNPCCCTVSILTQAMAISGGHVMDGFFMCKNPEMVPFIWPSTSWREKSLNANYQMSSVSPSYSVSYFFDSSQSLLLPVAT